MSLGEQSLLDAGFTTSTSRGPSGGDLGAVLVLTAAIGLTGSMLAGAAGWPILASPAGSGALLLGSLLSAALVVRRQGRRPGTSDHSSGLVLAVPALSVVAVAVIGAARGAPDGIAWFLNGDHPRHTVYVADTWVQGALTYSVEGYPHGWHSLLAAVWSATGAGLEPEAVVHLLEVMAFSSLLLSAALSLAMAHLGCDIAARLGLGRRASVAVGLVVGGTTLLNVFLANYQALGYENSLLAAVVVAVCSREVVVRSGSTVGVVVCAGGTVVLAHAWQLLLPVVAVTALWCARELWRQRDHRWLVVALAVATAVLGAPAVLAVVRGVGVRHATEAGPDSPVPLWILGAGALACVLVVTRSHDRRLRCAATLALLPSLVAVTLSLGLGIAILHYYPSKLLWQGALSGLPWLVAAAATLVHRRTRTLAGAHTVPRRVIAGLLAVGVACTLLLPWGSQAGAWSTVDARRVIAAISTARAPEATVVWLGASPTSDSVTRILLDVYRVASTRERAPQARLSLEQECSLLRNAAVPVVLSTEPEQRVRLRYACAPMLTVVRAGEVDPASSGAVRRLLDVEEHREEQHL